MKSLLVIKPSSLGDIVHGLQVVQTLAQARPEVKIAWIVRERFAPLVQAAPCVDETIIFRRRDGLKGFLRILRELRGRRFDVVWDMQGLFRSAAMTSAVHSRAKWGRPDAREGAGFFYHHKVARPAGPKPHHAVEVLLPFLATASVAPKIEWPLRLRDGDAFTWQKFFAGDPRSTFVMFTDSRGKEKEWGGFPALMKTILEKIPDSRIAWCAGRTSSPPVIVTEDRFLNLTGCPLDEMIALVRQPSVFIGNDSGPMHLSAACGNRVLAIFGPTSPRRFGPWPLESPRLCAIEAPGGQLDRLEPGAVMAALEELRRRSGV